LTIGPSIAYTAPRFNGKEAAGQRPQYAHGR